MASVGPELPLHLTENRKRQLDEDERKTSNYTPSPPADPRSRTPNSNPNKRSRTIGPSLPPTPLSERPSTPPSPTASASSSDSDFGPSLPPASSAALPAIPDPQHTAQVLPPDQTPQKPQRDEWMLVPPSNSDWSSRVDPTKLKNRTFQTGKGAKAPLPKGGGGDSTWTETLEQKKKRLEDEVMGAKQPAQLDAREGEDWKARLEDEDTRRRIREYDASTLFARLLLLV
ncbi:MAG: hypothetical protein LQ342_002516 [Letrouitia transgressa]|nr:MAG: hypothetical protein LQ342_002516 [Letrouitia transgressa]